MKNSVALILLLLLVGVTIGFSQSFQSCPEYERNALLDFKKNTIDPSNRLASWERETSCCKWYGVGCNNRTGHVIKLDLRNPFPGEDWSSTYEMVFKKYVEACLTVVEVNHSFLELQHLSYLDLSWNNFSGIRIPDFFGSFPKLRYLNLSSARFNGVIPHHLGNLSALLSLDLNNLNLNHMTLYVDNFQWIPSLSSLQYLDMSGVSLSGIESSAAISTFPSDLLELHLRDCELANFSLFHSHQNLTSLLVLDLSANFYMQSRIPNTIWNMTALEVLDLSQNQLDCSGTILDGFRYLRNLVKLDMIADSCVAILPNSLSCLKNLKYLDLSYNSFHGPIPPSFGNLTALEKLSIPSNELSGPIPMYIGKLSNLTLLSLSRNQFNGIVPESIGQLSKLKVLDFSSNLLRGALSEVHFVNLSQLEGLDLSYTFLTLKMKSNWIPPFQLNSLYLDNCRIGPQFPIWIQTQTEISTMLMSNASIVASMPFLFKNFHHNLDVLDLSGNQIRGTLSDIVSLDSRLRTINLSNNKISGTIPKNLSQMLSQLRLLLLSNNQINGSVPKSLCMMQSLAYIVFSNNNLSGHLPHCWSDLPSLRVIDFSSNGLSGNIPASIGTLPRLRSLHLNSNNFYGKLPATLQQCTELRLLDLGENKLSGEVPSWIGANLSSLEILRLRSNNFSGSLSLKFCYLGFLRVLDVADNSLSGSIPNCFGNFEAMVFHRGEKYWSSINNAFGYEEELSIIIKGRLFVYSRILPMVTNLDLSSNGLVGEIPEELIILSGLIGLNLSDNHLVGNIPHEIGQMTLLESLDFSRNHLSGTIPQSISSLSSLTHLNLSYNNLSGEIPSGNQLQTLIDPETTYKGNDELCGPPLSKSCSGDEPAQAPTDAISKEEGDEFNTKWFYIGMSCGVVVGFWGFWGTLFFKKSWRTAYFRFIGDAIDRVYDPVYVAIIVRLNRHKFRVQ